MTDEQWANVRYFTKSEFACHCGCGISNPSYKLVLKLDRARGRAGIPFSINSGSRCHQYNASRDVGGVDSSSHTATEEQESHAADIGATTSRARNKTQAALIEEGFNRFGLHDLFIHTDIDPGKDAHVTWLY